ncbi:hypothetical protein K435DRAFT_823066 [Dendrothele bispora CBS 962.96]|uniref:Helitron helicase-like domain-containing protein n=1 Tax=Dendrothele bispora (strain CBS 962.96) TaxID=1314807 RepID=A0A4S8L3Y2_DENBC|nr:hypothetical protein K435DRAFT_823066 [Dendrothele bispora CBS 962.96]
MKNDEDPSLPDLALHYGYHFVPEYNNPDLICGMFPTLFPLGIGGFEDPERKPSVSFESQSNYYLDLHDRRFHYHHSLFRRAQHLQVHFTTSSKRYNSVASSFASLSSETLKNLALRIEKEKYCSTLSEEEKIGFHLLKQVNTVAARIPGSQSAKVHIRNEIRSYFGYFGLPHLFFTFNPCAVHSPIFQVIYGDNSVDLNSLYPKLVPRIERAYRLAHDPVAGADFFDFCFKTAFQYLLGWDFKTGRSTDKGGIFGKLRAFYGTVELTEHGEFHVSHAVKALLYLLISMI